MFLRDYRIDLPEGESGPWTVKKFEVSNEAALIEMARMIMGSGRFVPAGTYTGLFRNGSIIMSDTPDELNDMDVLRNFGGHVLVAGLGLGCAIGYGLEHTKIEKITVVEKSADVIALSGTHWKERFGDRLTIIHADIFDWEPTEVFQHAWFDIWDTISTDNLKEFDQLQAKYRASVEHYMGFWASRIISKQRRGYCESCGESRHWCECEEECEETCDRCGWSVDDCDCYQCQGCGEEENDCTCKEKQ